MCSVSLPQGAMSWFALGIVVRSRHIHLYFDQKMCISIEFDARLLLLLFNVFVFFTSSR